MIHKPPRPGSLRARLFRVLAESPLPISTVDLALIVCPDLANRNVRVRQVLEREWTRRRVLRFPAVPPPDPSSTVRSVRWALTPLGLAVALAPPRPRAATGTKGFAGAGAEGPAHALAGTGGAS